MVTPQKRWRARSADWRCARISRAATDVRTLAETATKKFGDIDILVNNAGIGHKPQPLDTLPEETFDRIVAINAKSVFLTAREIVPGMKARKRGAILNIASTGGVSPRPNLTWYNASKGWMITATRAMAVELAPFGIRVNAINPVAGETPLLATFMGEDTPAIRAKFLASIPIGRFSTPDGHRRRRLLSLQRRSLHDHRGGAGSGWRPLHMKGMKT